VPIHPLARNFASPDLLVDIDQRRNAYYEDGIVITPSHNLPDDGGFKYKPPTGGPAQTDVTRWIEEKANQLLSSDLRNVSRLAFDKGRQAATSHTYDYVSSYVSDLGHLQRIQEEAQAIVDKALAGFMR
jgi:phosphoglucomutase